MTPEQKAREAIDQRLIQSGWILQDMRQLNPMAAPGVAVREFPTSTGPVDYALFIDGIPIGVVEAKADEKGENITTAEAQSSRYARSTFKWVKTDYRIRFAYEATGKLTRFTDYKDQKYRSRRIFSFHRPESLRELLKQDETTRNNMKHFPPLDTTGFRDCQVTAIHNLEKSFGENRPRALIQMATGAGKTFTAITAVYRLLKYAKINRVLFLVDTKGLGEQAEREFLAYRPNDDNRSFSQLYGVRRLKNSYLPNDVQVCISTIQRMYSILKGEELDESAEETSFNELTTADRQPAKEVVYNEKYPPEFFDCIIIDECHRSIYNVWQQVLDYFDAFLIGLTATPDKRTFAFFNENVVSEYSREQAIIDGVNVGEDIFLIETQVSKRGAHIMKQMIEYRNRLSREKRWKQMDEDVDYRPTQLDRDIVNPSQIRTVIRSFRENLFTRLFPRRREVPKTLIFAKTDSHADDIVQIVREEFGEGNEFCQKITYSAQDPEGTLSSFRNSYNPRIAVTVDMIATGTDVKPIECLIFMRDVRSRNYFEQMKGRGTRILSKDDLQKVTPSATENKDHFVIVDAVGVTTSKKSDTRVLERKPSVSLKELMLNVALGARDENTLTSLAGRIIRLNSQMSPGERKEFTEVVGLPANKLAEELLDAFDEDVLTAAAREKFHTQEPTAEQVQSVQKEAVAQAAAPFCRPEVRDFIENVRRSHEQIMMLLKILETLGEQGGTLGKIFQGAVNKISNAAILYRIVQMIDKENWVSMSTDVKGEIYEGLLQKNAEDVKSGAGQYFTPRPLIRAMVECIRPEPRKTIADPCCGSGGFLLAAQSYLSDPKHYTLDREAKEFLKRDTFRGWEIVPATFKMSLMNLFLHNIGDLYGEVPITLGDALLTDPGERFDYVLTNPPFGKKSSLTFTNEEGEQEEEDLVYNRQDFWTTSSNKQLNFLQHINTLLKATGKAAVVVPDNVLFEGGAGETIRKKLLETCDLHTILRLPTGIFYKPGVKANVIFFDKRPASPERQTKEVWFYDLRTNLHFTLKQHPMTYEDLKDFIRCYHPENRYERHETWSQDNPDGRWRRFTAEEILNRDKTSLDIFWIKDKALADLDNLPAPEELAEDILENLQSAMDGFSELLDALKQ